MGKGYKRKTQWRTLNIADCPLAVSGEKDDDRTRESMGSSTRSNSQCTHKTSLQLKNEQKYENSNDINESASVSHSKSESIFDENEYTRITTPRQDLLIKKGYLARRKGWPNNHANTSATPSITESQSASHSTADGSETTEDQQLLDYRENGIENYSTQAEPPPPQMSYGTFYDHASGYYYEYPIMVMGLPVTGPPVHNVLGAMPCQAVPLRPIKWVNPAFVPKVDHPYYLIDYSVDQHYPLIVDENEAFVPPKCTNGTNDPVENGHDNKNWPEIAEDEEECINGDDNHSQRDAEDLEETQNNAFFEVATAENNFQSEPPLETVLAQQLHVSHHILPPALQPYMYPGHYMFGPAFVNVNDMTIQNGQMMVMSKINDATSTFNRFRKKKRMKHKKSRRPIGPDNICGYGLEEEDYCSEAENAKIQTSIIGANTFTSSSTINSRPLNPNCKEFEFKTNNTDLQNDLQFENSSTNPMTTPLVEHNTKESEPSEKILLNHVELSHEATSIQDVNESPDGDTNIEFATEAIPNDSDRNDVFCGNQETEIGVDVTCVEFNDIVENLEKSCDKLSLQNDSLEISSTKKQDRISNGTSELYDMNGIQRLKNYEKCSKNITPKNIYRGAGGNINIVQESTSGDELNEKRVGTPENDLEVHVNCVAMGVDAIEAQMSMNTSNGDSGFKSQTNFSDHPITDAVAQWLHRTTSPELFITTKTSKSKMTDSDMEDDELDDGEQSKNLQGNPMSALSANSITNDIKIMSSRTANCSEFARISNCTVNNETMKIKKKNKRVSNDRKRISKSISEESTEKRTSVKDKSNCCEKRKKNRGTKMYTKFLKKQQHDICEFTAVDSVAGMRVAVSTRIYSNQSKDKTDNDKNERRIESSRNVEMNLIGMDFNRIKTFKQGQIIISKDGKLLPTTIYEIIRSSACESLKNFLIDTSDRNLIESIEESDMFECWKGKTLESIINTKQLLQDSKCRQNIEIDNSINSQKVSTTNLDLLRKYYTLARGSIQSFSSIEDGVNDTSLQSMQSQSKLIMPRKIIEMMYCEKMSSMINLHNTLNKQLPVNKGIEVYKSCYTGQKLPVSMTPNFYKSYSLRDKNGSVPSKAACCLIQ